MLHAAADPLLLLLAGTYAWTAPFRAGLCISFCMCKGEVANRASLPVLSLAKSVVACKIAKRWPAMEHREWLHVVTPYGDVAHRPCMPDKSRLCSSNACSQHRGGLVQTVAVVALICLRSTLQGEQQAGDAAVCFISLCALWQQAGHTNL